MCCRLCAQALTRIEHDVAQNEDTQNDEEEGRWLSLCRRPDDNARHLSEDQPNQRLPLLQLCCQKGTLRNA
jgi:hypothetical protein